MLSPVPELDVQVPPRRHDVVESPGDAGVSRQGVLDQVPPVRDLHPKEVVDAAPGPVLDPSAAAHLLVGGG